MTLLGGERQVEARIKAEVIQTGQVAEEPLLGGGVAAGDGEHRGVDVYTGAVVAQLGESDRDPPGAAAGIEYPGGRLQQRCAERGLAVDVVARFDEPRETLSVLFPSLSAGQFRPTVGLPGHVHRVLPVSLAQEGTRTREGAA